MSKRVLVTEALAPRGLESMRAAGLVAAIPGAAALVIRSATQVTAEVLAAGTELVVVGRAGIGLDNVDVAEATRRGVMVGGRGVRLDTSNTMVDRSLWPQMGRFDPRGVNPQLVWNVRNALDAAGHAAVRIVVSGGFTSEKIRAFEAAGVPVDSYGVGSALIRGENDFTADVVLVDGEERGKAGRAHAPTDRVERVR